MPCVNSGQICPRLAGLGQIRIQIKVNPLPICYTLFRCFKIRVSCMCLIPDIILLFKNVIKVSILNVRSYTFSKMFGNGCVTLIVCEITLRRRLSWCKESAKLIIESRRGQIIISAEYLK